MITDVYQNDDSTVYYDEEEIQHSVANGDSEDTTEIINSNEENDNGN